MSYGPLRKTPNISIESFIQSMGNPPSTLANMLLIGHCSVDTNPPVSQPGFPQVQFYVPMQLPAYTDPDVMLQYMQNLGFTVVYGLSFNESMVGPTSIAAGEGTSMIFTWSSKPAGWDNLIAGLTGTVTQIQTVPDPATVTGTYMGLGPTGYSIIVDNITGGSFQITTSIGLALMENNGEPDPLKTDEIAMMVYKAMQGASQSPIGPTISISTLQQSDTGFGSSNQVFVNCDPFYYNGIVMPYEIADDTDITTTYVAFFNYISQVNQPNEVQNGHFRTFGFYANVSTTAILASTLPDIVNSQYCLGAFYPYDNTVELVQQPAAQIAAGAAANIICNIPPYNSLDNIVIPGISPPTDLTTKIAVNTEGASETVLNQGWTPITVNSDQQAAFVRTVTSLLLLTSSVPVSAFFDIQDWQVISYNIQVKYLRFKAAFTNVKLSRSVATKIKAMAISIDRAFEGANMFQGVQQAAKFYQVFADPNDRSRVIVQTPVDVLPNLHSILDQIGLTTQFDQTLAVAV